MPRPTATLTLATLLAACSTAPRPLPPPAALPRETPGAAVTITRVQPPWYTARFLIVRGFRKSVPEYQVVPGLARKAYTLAATDGHFGGVYLWHTRADAEAWFTPAWFSRVRKSYGVEGEVRTLDIARVLEAPSTQGVEEGPMVAALTRDTLSRYADATGLRWAAEGEGQVVSVWHTRAAADAFFAGAPGVEWFDAPLALDNGVPQSTEGSSAASR